VRTDRLPDLRSRTKRGLGRGANAVARVATAVALLAGVRRRDPTVVVNGVLSLVFAALPGYLARAYGVRFRPWQRAWISTAGLVHTLGMLGPYDRIWWWDHLAHTLSGVVIAGVADVSVRAGAERGDSAATLRRSRASYVAGITLGFGILWECFEYVVHAVADRLGFEPLLVHYGRLDAVADVLFDLLGAALVLGFGRWGLSNVVESIPER
jgi:hypothetical protein